MLQKFSIKNKLLIVFLIIAGVCLPLNWFVLALTQQMNDRYADIIIQSYFRNHTLSEIRRVAFEISRTSAKIEFDKGDSAQAEGTLGSEQEYDLLSKLEELNQWKNEYEYHASRTKQQSFLDLKNLNLIERSLILQTLKIIELQEDRSAANLVQAEEHKLINTQKQLDSLIVLSVSNEHKFWYKELNALHLEAQNLKKIVYIICFADLLLIIILAFTIANKIAKPIIALRDVVSKVTAGNYQVRAVNNSEDEIGQLANDVNQMIEALINTQRLQIQLMNSEKMASLGQLAAGIAHEINTPIQYVGHNMEFLKDSFTDIIAFFMAIKSTLGSQLNTVPAFNNIDIDYLNEEIPQTIAQSMEGIAQVARIVKSMNEFSHPGTSEKVPTDLNQAVENTLAVTRSTWKDVAEIKLDLAPDLPVVNCLPNEINQVLMNLIVNATHAIEPTLVNGTVKGTITIASRVNNKDVEIRISDTGTGIPQNVQSKIFDPFFTTKEVGKGTGQGLTIAHAIVEKRHDGELIFETQEGKGTTFIVRLPIT